VTRRTDTPMTSEYGETLPVQIGEMAIFGSETIMTIDDFDSYMPTGCIALSQGKTVEISSGSDGSNLTDVDLATTWAPDDTDAAPYACIDLEAPYALRRVVLFPHNDPYGEDFPASYTVVIRRTWRAGQRPRLPAQPCRKSRWLSNWNSRWLGAMCISAADGEPLKLAELAVFGESPEAHIELDRTALELVPGDTDQLKATLVNDSALPLTQKDWASSDDTVVTVDADGNLTAVGVGEADITVSNHEYGHDISASCHVYVVSARRDIFNENILISMFWPPIGPDYITEEQYQWLAEAGINYRAPARSRL
ncbi:MAG: Ig-like domain-containing protein, partial [Clostridia bacterium]